MSSTTSRIKSAMNRVLGWLLFTCRDMSRLSSQALDTRLPLFTRLRMKVHWLICKWCRRYRDQLQLLRRNVSLLGNEGPDTGPTLPGEFRDRIRKKLHENDGL